MTSRRERCRGEPMGWQGADERAQALSAACELQAQKRLGVDLSLPWVGS